MSNPKSFVRECKTISVTYDLLLEAHETVGKQATARMFNGKSKRGGGGFCSAASIENWVETFKYVMEHPDEDDHDPYQAREVSPNKEWYKFVELIHTPIDPLIISSWKKMSKKKLGDEAKKYGFTVGVANSKSLANIHERMFEMTERRRERFWTKLGLNDSDSKQGDPDYKLMNIFQLKELAKERGISTNLDKDTLISEIIVDQEDEDSVFEYIDMSLNKLKLLAKDRGLLEYNNLQKDELIQALKQKDIDDQKDKEQKDRILLGGIEVISRVEDGYINATQLCKAGGKEFKKWHKNDKTKEFLETLSIREKISVYMEEKGLVTFLPDPPKCLIDIKVDGDNDDRGTWVHPQVAIHISYWISSEFAVNVTGWIQQLLSTGSVSLERPVKAFATLTEMDIEAEVLEEEVKLEEYTTDSVIYASYIGKGMLKIGFSDGRMLQRNKKHTSSESMYSQWRLIKIFKVSGRPIEKMLHDFLLPYQVEFNKQKEVYKSTKKLASFLQMTETFLDENDLPMKIRRLEQQVHDLQLENMQLKLQISRMI
jgi:predicted HTH domain antitoxin